MPIIFNRDTNLYHFFNAIWIFHINQGNAQWAPKIMTKRRQKSHTPRTSNAPIFLNTDRGSSAPKPIERGRGELSNRFWASLVRSIISSIWRNLWLEQKVIRPGKVIIFPTHWAFPRYVPKIRYVPDPNCQGLYFSNTNDFCGPLTSGRLKLTSKKQKEKEKSGNESYIPCCEKSLCHSFCVLKKYTPIHLES